jgi:hypothetical protein
MALSLPPLLVEPPLEPPLLVEPPPPPPLEVLLELLELPPEPPELLSSLLAQP